MVRGAARARQIGSERLMMPDTYPAKPAARARQLSLPGLIHYMAGAQAARGS